MKSVYISSLIPIILLYIFGKQNVQAATEKILVTKIIVNGQVIDCLPDFGGILPEECNNFVPYIEIKYI